MKTNTITLLFLSFFVTVFTSFKKPKQPAWQKEKKNKALKIVVISDLNAEYGSLTYPADVAATIARISIIKPDLVLCGGDMVSGQKASLTEQNISQMWQSFNKIVLQPLHQLNLPFGFTMGNHDASPSFKTDRRLAKEFWDKEVKHTNLTFVDSTNYPFYFSYLKSNVFFITWDAAGAKIKPEVYNWMKQQLASNVAKQARLRILLGHLPLYAIVAAKNKPGEVNANADSALAFFKANGIDLYISGHQHAYYPAQKNGVQLLNLGAIGDAPRPILGHTDTAKKAYTVIEISVKQPKKFTYKTFMPTNNLVIDIKNLPDSVVGFNGTIKRRDKFIE